MFFFICPKVEADESKTITWAAINANKESEKDDRALSSCT